MKEPYELSLWADQPNSGSTRYDEKKIAVLASDTTNSEISAYGLTLTESVEGTHKLTFKILSKYFDNEQQKKVDNPFLSLLVNERKVKLKWKNEWYDLVIKDISEDSSTKEFTYTCSDSYINELSKTGFSIVLDTDLYNNQDTVENLAARVLDGSDWRAVDANAHPLSITNNVITPDTTTTLDVASDTIKQERTEAVYEFIRGNEEITAFDENIGEAATIPVNAIILVFRTQLTNLLATITGDSASGTTQLYFAYAPGGEYKRDANSMLVNNSHSFYAANVPWTYTKVTSGQNIQHKFTFWNKELNYTTGVSSTYRANQLVSSQKTIQDPLSGRLCSIYKQDNTNKIVYGYMDSEYATPTAVNDIITNGSSFTTLTGWVLPSPSVTLYPAIDDTALLSSWSGKGYLRLYSNTYNIYNSGLTYSGSYLSEGLQKGDKYVFRYKAISGNSESPSGSYINTLNFEIGGYTESGGIKTYNGTSIINKETATYDATSHYVTQIFTVTTSKTRAQFYNDSIGIFLKGPTQGEYVWLEEAQLFALRYSENGVMLTPGNFDTLTAARARYNYYIPSDNSSATSMAEVNFLYRGTTDYDQIGVTIHPEMNPGHAKIKSVSVKESNRFNILQELSETFECWVRFEIVHNADGSIQLDSNNKPKKYVYFKNEFGRDTGLGFVYGIDLKSIRRTLNSDEIVTKTIVIQNTNEYADQGFCDISRAKSNYSKGTSIYNLDYYVNKGFLSGITVNNDFYNETEGIGYYTRLRIYNEQYDEYQAKLDRYTNDKVTTEQFRDMYQIARDSAAESITSYKSKLCEAAGLSTISLEDAKAYVKAHENNEQIKGYLSGWSESQSAYTSYSDKYNNCITNLTTITTAIASLETAIAGILTNITALDKQLYSKYANYIKEGTWKDDSYIDDDLYYLDALSVSYTSSRPKISYDISVARVGMIEEFENKIFKLGDIAYVEDTDFFGYDPTKAVKTPYKEKVIIAEITSHLDDPSKDTIKVQNYHTQFDDLFQRITASAQSLQYNAGNYSRAANAVEADGSISASALQSAFDTNKELAISALNDTVVTDSTGSLYSSQDNPNNQLKINSNGVFISVDGGTSWRNAINSKGVATDVLTAGSINANEISIYQGKSPSFRWDSAGINAFATHDNGTVNTGKFVRMDKYGIYGVEGANNQDFNPTGTSNIRDNAQFGVLWDGFFLKNKTNDGRVEISSENDISVFKKNASDVDIERIKIGNLGTSASPLYGMRIRDASGASILEAKDDGSLWLQKLLTIGNGITSTVSLGYNPAVVRTGTSFHEVINANSNFKVYEDGYIQSTAGTVGGWYLGNDILRNGNSINTSTVGMRCGANYGAQSLVNTTTGNYSPIRFYAGRTGSITEQGDNSTKAKFIVTNDGSLYASAAKISGNIEATSGRLSSVAIGSNTNSSLQITDSGLYGTFYYDIDGEEEASTKEYQMELKSWSSESGSETDAYLKFSPITTTAGGDFNYAKYSVSGLRLTRRTDAVGSDEEFGLLADSYGLSFSIADVTNLSSFIQTAGLRYFPTGDPSGSSWTTFTDHVQTQGRIILGSDTYIAGHLNETLYDWINSSGVSINARNGTGTNSLKLNEYSNNVASGTGALAEGGTTTASGNWSHAENAQTVASGNSSHAEGQITVASGECSHAEGNQAQATNKGAHAQGLRTHATGQYSYAGGVDSYANGTGSFSQGQGTKASSNYQVALGQFNVEDSAGSYPFLFGWGASSASRKNFLAIDANGNLRVKGTVYVGANDDSTGGSAVGTSTKYRHRIQLSYHDEAETSYICFDILSNTSASISSHSALLSSLPSSGKIPATGFLPDYTGSGLDGLVMSISKESNTIKTQYVYSNDLNSYTIPTNWSVSDSVDTI